MLRAGLIVLLVGLLGLLGWLLWRGDNTCEAHQERLESAVLAINNCMRIPGCSVPFAKVERAVRLSQAAKAACPKAEQ